MYIMLKAAGQISFPPWFANCLCHEAHQPRPSYRTSRPKTGNS